MYFFTNALRRVITLYVKRQHCRIIYLFPFLFNTGKTNHLIIKNHSPKTKNILLKPRDSFCYMKLHETTFLRASLPEADKFVKVFFSYTKFREGATKLHEAGCYFSHCPFAWIFCLPLRRCRIKDVIVHHLFSDNIFFASFKSIFA